MADAVPAGAVPGAGEGSLETVTPPAHGAPARRERLAYAAYRGAEAIVGRIPHRLAYAVGAGVAEATLRVAPGRFDGLAANLRQALPDVDEGTRRRVLHANVRNLARSWVDVMEMRTRADTVAARVHPVDVENMTAPLARGRGALIVSMHLGAWEVGLAAWNHRFGRMSVLAEELRPAELFDHIVRTRTGMGVTVIPIDTTAMRGSEASTARRLGVGAVREVLRTLHGGGMVAVALDRDLIGNGEPLPFFGAPAPIPVGVVDLAIRAGAAIVPVILLRCGDSVVAPCWPEITYDARADRREETRRVGACLVEVFETVISEHPDQWHVLDPIWEAGPG